MDKVQLMRWLLGLLILLFAQDSLAKVKTPEGKAKGKRQVAPKIGLAPLNNDVYEVGLGEGVAPLRGTGSHPLYSLDRDDWVRVRDLQIGERLQTAEGAVSVEALEKVRGLHRVYNLEVEGDHEYLVGDAGVRAHNTCPKGYAPKGADGKPLPLPRGKNGELAPSSSYPHTQIGTRQGRRSSYRQTREFGENGKPVKQVDWTDHGRPQNHTNPHVHDYVPNPTGGTPQLGPARPPMPGELGD